MPEWSQPYTHDRGPHAVAELGRSAHDAGRERCIPLRIFHPYQPAERPTVFFSPGLGAAAGDYDYLLTYLATFGYTCIHVTHPEHDDRLWHAQDRPALTFRAEMAKHENWVLRPADLAFALRTTLSDDNLKPLVDDQRLATMGHSYGAFTAMTLAGLRFQTPDGRRHDFRDPRIAACVAMSPQGPGTFGLRDNAWSQLATPLLSFTGTFDRGLQTNRVAERFTAHERSPGRDNVLAVLSGGSHHAFSTSRGLGARPLPRKPHHHAVICQLICAYLDAVLRDDPRAQSWLLGPGPAELLGTNGRLSAQRLHWT
jgi:predicted dienelactone hydrolase